MKIKPQTIYRTPYGGFATHNFTDYTPVEAYYIHTREEGDFNRVRYSQRQAESTRSTKRAHCFFFPHPGADFMPDLIRGKTFFSAKDGFLFGAYAALTKLGTFTSIPV